MRKLLQLFCLFITLNTFANNPGYLGIMIKGYTSTSLTGVQVVNVFDDGAAKVYGLKENDIITSVNGKTVKEREDVPAIVKQLNWGDEVSLNIVRNNIPQTISVHLGYKASVRTYNVKKSIINQNERWYFSDDQTEIILNSTDNTPISISKKDINGTQDTWNVNSNYTTNEVPQYFLDLNDKVESIKRIKADQARRNCTINDIQYIKEVVEPKKDSSEAETKEEVELRADIFSVYPNPTNGIFNVNVSSNEIGSLQINIFDVTGRIVKQIAQADFDGKSFYTIDFSAEAKGIYLIQLQIGDKQTTKRLLLQ